MVDVTPPDSNSNSNLTKSRERYEKKKQDLEDQYNDDLQSIKSKYDRKLHEEENAGKAAVNHIREQSRYTRETAERSAAENEKAADNQLAIKQENLRRRQATQDAYLEQAKRRHATWTQAQEKNLQHQKGEMNARTEEEIKDIRSHNSQRVHEAEKRVAADTSEIEDQGQNRLRQLRNDYEHRIHSVDERENEKFHDVQDGHQRQLEAEQQSFHSALRKEKVEHAQTLDELRNQHTQEISSLRANSEKDVQSQRAQGEKRVEEAQTYHDKEIKRERGRYEKARTTEEDKDRHALDRLNAQDQTEQKQIKERHEQDVRRENDEYSKEIKGLETRHQEQRSGLLTRQHKELEMAQTAHQQRMDAQQMEFERRYDQNEDFAREAYANQDLVLGRALLGQKQKYLRAADKYKGTDGDPFYQIRDNKTKLKETAGAYIFQASVPEHDKDNVHVRVKGDKIILSGNRHFNDEIVGDDRIVRTNNVQTFDEEYTLPKRVREDQIIQDYRDGVLTVTIPKVT